MNFGILVHEADDDVGVAVMDLQAGTTIGAATLEGEELGILSIIENIPLGHKVAIHNLPEDKPVIEYGRPIGYATQRIEIGAHVHVHNLQTLRWAQ